jgi:hypothetical protein
MQSSGRSGLRAPGGLPALEQRAEQRENGLEEGMQTRGVDAAVDRHECMVAAELAPGGYQDASESFSRLAIVRRRYAKRVGSRRDGTFGDRRDQGLPGREVHVERGTDYPRPPQRRAHSRCRSR